MKRQLRAKLLVTVMILSGVAGLLNWPLSADQPGTPTATTQTAAKIMIRVSTTVISEDDAKNFAFEWVFGNTMLGAPCSIEATTNEVSGRTAAILPVKQFLRTFGALERRHQLYTFPSLTILSGQPGKIPLDDGQSVNLTPILSEDGFTVEINTTAILRELNGDGSQPLRKTSLTANLRDSQAIVLSELSNRGESASTTNKRVRLVLVWAAILGPDGKPLHDWRIDDPQTRVYLDARPRFQPEIPAQRSAANR